MRETDLRKIPDKVPFIFANFSSFSQAFDGKPVCCSNSSRDCTRVDYNNSPTRGDSNASPEELMGYRCSFIPRRLTSPRLEEKITCVNQIAAGPSEVGSTHRVIDGTQRLSTPFSGNSYTRWYHSNFQTSGYGTMIAILIVCHFRNNKLQTMIPRHTDAEHHPLPSNQNRHVNRIKLRKTRP